MSMYVQHVPANLFETGIGWYIANRYQNYENGFFGTPKNIQFLFEERMVNGNQIQTRTKKQTDETWSDWN